MIRILVAGTVASGKTSIAEIIRVRLSGLGLEVEVKDTFDVPHTEVQSEGILRELRPRVEIETVQLNRQGEWPQGLAALNNRR